MDSNSGVYASSHKSGSARHDQYPKFYSSTQQPSASPYTSFMDAVPQCIYSQRAQVMQHPNMPIQQQPNQRTWFRISKDEVRNLTTGQQCLNITRQARSGLPSELSSKPFVVMNKPDGSTLGTVRYHSISSSDIDFAVNGNSSKLSDSGLLSTRYGFMPTCRGAVTTLGRNGAKWYWKMQSDTSGVLEDAKKGGQTLARMEDGSLVFEASGLSNAECDEILVTAIAVAEKARRNKKDEGIAEVVSQLLGAGS